jgi:glycosyltransferase involved in cell wall biosynthesis
MKILFLVSQAVLGGHILSASTVARYIKKQGHEVSFAGGCGQLTPIIEQDMPFFDISIPFFHGRLPTYFTWKSFSSVSNLRKLIREQNFDLIHAFDARAYIHAHIAGLLENKPVLCTLCGGTDPQYDIPITDKIIVFSEEQRNKMVRGYRWSPSRVQVIRTRLDIDTIINDTGQPPVSLDLDPLVPSIMMISSFDATKSTSIRQVMKMLSRLADHQVPFQMVFIGGKGAFWEEMRQKGERLNAALHRKAVVFTGPVLHAYRLLRQATIVFGVGRSAFEGMAYAKPTLVVGERGFAGIVSPEHIEQISYYNFSGRNQQALCADETFAQVVKDLLLDENARNILGRFGYDFVVREIDVKHGIGKIEEVYRAVLAGNSSLFKIRQFCSLLTIMPPIWRDNIWHTVGMPLKRLVGKVK